MGIWHETTVEKGTVCQWQIGPLDVWVQHQGDEWQIATGKAHTPDAGEERLTSAVHTVDAPAGLEWRRWVVSDPADAVRLKPAMPDRPVVVRPEYPIRLPPKQQALFYLSIPVWVQVTVNDGKLVLCEQPSMPLSNIWFGDYASGELCYSLKTRARRDVDADHLHPHRAICPVSVSNRAQTELDFQRLCIRVSHLRIEERGDRLWTNQVNVTFRGEDQASRIDYQKPNHKSQGAAVVLAEPRAPLEGSIVRRSFRSLGFPA